MDGLRFAAAVKDRWPLIKIIIATGRVVGELVSAGVFCELRRMVSSPLSLRTKFRFPETETPVRRDAVRMQAFADPNQVSDGLSHLNSGPRTVHQCRAHSPYQA
jgi:hypothetical protein